MASGWKARIFERKTMTATPAQALQRMYDVCTGIRLRDLLGREQMATVTRAHLSADLYEAVGPQMLRSMVKILPSSTIDEMSAAMSAGVTASAVFLTKANAIIADMIAAGVDAIIAAPGPLVQELLAILQQLLPMLIACIPAGG
jgi:hypothetical protein